MIKIQSFHKIKNFWKSYVSKLKNVPRCPCICSDLIESCRRLFRVELCWARKFREKSLASVLASPLPIKSMPETVMRWFIFKEKESQVSRDISHLLFMLSFNATRDCFSLHNSHSFVTLSFVYFLFIYFNLDTFSLSILLSFSFRN